MLTFDKNTFALDSKKPKIKVGGFLLQFSVFYMAFIAMSPVFNHFGWRGIYTLAAFFGLVSISALKRRAAFKLWFIFSVSVMFISSTITSLYWADPRFVLSLVFFIFSLYVIQFLSRSNIENIVDISSLFIFIVLVLSVLGLIFSLSGFGPVFEIANPDGRPNYFFYTTFSNTYFGNFIRPSGLYDEPGSLSLYVCLVAAMRHVMGKDNKFTWTILLLGFVTVSLAHLIYCVVHLSSERVNKNNIFKFCVLASLSTILVFSTGFDKMLSERLLGRLEVTESGTIAGDNRSFRMINAVELISDNKNVFFFGADPTCRFDYEVCKDKFPPMGENPLSPLAFEGILVSWPYYTILFGLVIVSFRKRKYWVCLGVALLLLQRPTVTSMATAMAVLLFVTVVVQDLRTKKTSDILN